MTGRRHLLSTRMSIKSEPRELQHSIARYGRYVWSRGRASQTPDFRHMTWHSGKCLERSRLLGQLRKMSMWRRYDASDLVSETKNSRGRIDAAEDLTQSVYAILRSFCDWQNDNAIMLNIKWVWHNITLFMWQVTPVFFRCKLTWRLFITGQILVQVCRR